ncbi:MAG: hypothetical protein KGI83_03820 [Verrucomicrobiota bacterium]|nr:hypothetical protein [Verrucomicrobiota bacterium]
MVTTDVTDQSNFDSRPDKSNFDSLCWDVVTREILQRVDEESLLTKFGQVNKKFHDCNMIVQLRIARALKSIQNRDEPERSERMFDFATRFVARFGNRSDEKQTPVWLTSDIVGRIFKLSFGGGRNGLNMASMIATDSCSNLIEPKKDDLPYFYYLLRDCPLPREVLFDQGIMWPACHFIQQSLVNGRSIKFLAPVLENLLRSREQEIAKYKNEREAGGAVDRQLDDTIELVFPKIWAPNLLGALNGDNPECASLVKYCRKRMGLP